MHKFHYTITAFDDDIDDIAIRLGDCQQYSDKIAQQILSDSEIDVEKDHLNFFQLCKLLKKRKDLIVTFYCIKENKRFHIFSEFFNLDGAFSDAFSFFDDLNRVLLMCEKTETEIIVDLIKRGKKLFHFIVGMKDGKEVEPSLWQQDYKKICSFMSGLPSVSDIEGSLDFILQNDLKSDHQMHTYLEQNALFKDDYII